MKRTISYKVSDGCNLACSYCYERRRTGGLCRDYSTHAVSILEKLEDYARKPGPLSLMLCLHGGEPLLMGVESYSDLCEGLLRINKLPEKRVALSIQTNGTLISKAWAKCFARYKCLFDGNGIGISLDGDAYIQNYFRKTTSGESSYNLVLRGIDNLKAEGISFGLLGVVTKPSLSRVNEIYKTMSELNPVVLKFVPCFDFLPNGELTSYSVTPLEFSAFLKKIFTLWIKSGISLNKSIVEPIFSCMLNLTGKKSPWCEYSYQKCENFMLINSTGSVGVCDNLPSYTDSPNVQYSDFESCFSYAPQEFLAFRELMDRECSNCSIKELCKGGCMGTRYNFYMRAASHLKNEYCQGKRQFFADVKSIMDMLPN